MELNPKVNQNIMEHPVLYSVLVTKINILDVIDKADSKHIKDKDIIHVRDSAYFTETSVPKHH